jgi:hypothetical protein
MLLKRRRLKNESCQNVGTGDVLFSGLVIKEAYTVEYIYQNSMFCSVKNMKVEDLLAEAYLVGTGAEALGWLVIDRSTFIIKEAGWEVTRSPGGSLNGSGILHGLKGKAAYFNCGADLRGRRLVSRADWPGKCWLSASRVLSRLKLLFTGTGVTRHPRLTVNTGRNFTWTHAVITATCTVSAASGPITWAVIIPVKSFLPGPKTVPSGKFPAGTLLPGFSAIHFMKWR